MHRARSATVCAMTLAGVVSTARAQTFAGLGVLPGTVSSYAGAVSGDGGTVVGACADSAGFSHGYIWRRGVGMASISSNTRIPQGVSFDGSVVVGYYGGAWRW